MPIPFHCEHCGHYTLVADDYAGKTGACAGCGRAVTVPLIAKSKRAPGKLLIVIPLVACVVLAFILMISAALVVSTPVAFRPTVSAASRNNSNNLRRIGLALHNYHDSYGTFPPAYIQNEDDTRRTSWRALLLPLAVQPALASQYDYAHDWDSAENQRIRNTIVSLYRAQGVSSNGSLETHFMLITGPGTAFEGDSAKRLDEFINGTAKTAIAVQVRSMGIDWSEPKDIGIHELPLLLKSGVLADERGYVRYLMADGSVQEMDTVTALSRLPAMAMIGKMSPPPVAGAGDPINPARAMTMSADSPDPGQLQPKAPSP